MISRPSLVAALVAIEFVIAGGMVAAVRGDQSTHRPHDRVPGVTGVPPGAGLAEEGPHHLFDAGSRPVVTVDIGYADLTVRTRDSSHIDVSLSKNSDFGPFRAKEPITARKDGNEVHITTGERRGWSVGDDRRVTVVVPPQTRVTVVRAGDIEASGLRAESSFTSVGRGTIAVEDFDAPALHVAASNGAISLVHVAAPRLEIESSNGRVVGTALRVRDGSIESTNGRVTLGLASGSDSVVTAAARNGKVRVTGFTATGSPRDPDASDASDQSGDSGDTSSQTVHVGPGTGHLVVHAGNGSISLSQES